MDILRKITGTKLQLRHCYAYTPDELWRIFQLYATEYLTPAVVTRYVTSGKDAGTAFEVEVERPLSVKAFCSYAQIATINKGWDNAIDEILRSDNPACAPYREVASLISDFVEAQLLEGGLLSKFNAAMASNTIQGKYNKAFMQDASGGTSKIEHTINFKSFAKDVDKAD